VRPGFLQERPLGAGQVAAGFQVVGQALGLVERPGLEGREELALVDQAVLKREQSEKEMAVSGGGRGMAPSGGSRSGESPQRRGPASYFIDLMHAKARFTGRNSRPWSRGATAIPRQPAQARGTRLHGYVSSSSRTSRR
jgi:hypothetical protein